MQKFRKSLMKEHILRLLKGTFIYGGGQFLSRMVTFLLLPLTTAYLTPEDYGVIGSLAIISQLLSSLLTLGFGVSLGRCYWSTQDAKERHGIIWVAFNALLVNILIWSSIGYLFSDKLSWMMLGSANYSWLVVLTLFSTALSASMLPFSTYLRLQEKALLVVTVSLGEVLTTTTSMLGLVIYFDRHAQGVIEAGLLGQCFSFICLFAIGLKELNLCFSWKYLKDMLRIGYPYIAGLLGYFLLQCSSRYVLQLESNLEEVGLFFMGSNFARVIELVVVGFISAWPPFFTSFIDKKEEAKKLFGKVLSYYVIGVSSILICFFAFAKPIVYLMVQPPYFQVWTVIGLLAASWALWGVYSISATGFIFYKKSLLQVFVEIGGGLLCVALNFLFIPFLHKEGAALATLFGFCGLVGMSFYFNLRLFFVEYEIRRIIQVVAALSIGASLTFLPIQSHLLYCSWMAVILLSFYAYLWGICLTDQEKIHIFSLLRISKKSSQIETI